MTTATNQPQIIYASDNFGGETWAWDSIEKMEAEWEEMAEEYERSTGEPSTGELVWKELELGDDGLYYDGKNEHGYTWQANGQLDYNI
jgi:hypothetical protein